MSYQLAEEYINEGAVKDFSTVKPEFRTIKTGFREYRKTIEQVLVKTAASKIK